MPATDKARPGRKPRPEVRDTLIDAGLAVMHSRGYSATGISDITDAADVAKGSFYYYFDSKEAFGVAVGERFYEQVEAGTREVLQDARLPADRRLVTFFEQRIPRHRKRGYSGGCFMANLALEVADHSEPVRASLSSHFEHWCALLAQCLEEARRDGTLVSKAPTAQLARHLINSWEGALVRMRVDKTEQSLQDFMDLTLSPLFKS